MPDNRKIRLSAGLQNLLATLPSRPVSTPEYEEEEGLFADFGGIFKKALPYAAQKSTWIGGKALDALDLSRQYVAKPLLGMGVYLYDADEWHRRYGEFSYEDLRTSWDEAPVPGIVKFGLEMAFDPTNYIGLGLGKTVTARFAEAALPMALKSGPLAALGTTAARATMIRSINSVPEASKVLQKLVAGSDVAKADIDSFVRAASGAGVSKEWVNHTVRSLQSGNPALFRAMRPGIFTRALGDNSITRGFGMVDTLADSLWGTAMSVPGMAIGRAPLPNRNQMIQFFNKAGETFPVKGVNSFLAHTGPAVFRTQQEMARNGRLGSWWFGASIRSAEKDVSRTTGSILAALKYHEATTGKSIREILDNAKFGDGTLLDEVPFVHVADPQQAAAEKFTLLNTIAPMDDNDYLKFISALDSPTEDFFQNKLFNAIRPVRYAELGAVQDLKFTPNFKDMLWDVVGKAVNFWRPLVTTLQPISWPLLQFGDNIGRAGTSIVGEYKATDDLQRAVGILDSEIIYGSSKGTGEILQEEAGVLWSKFKNRTLFGGVTLEDAIKGESSVGPVAHPLVEALPWGRIQARLTTKADSSVLREVAEQGAAEGYIRRILGPDGPPHLKALLDEIDTSDLNPQVKEWMKRHVPSMIHTPKKWSKIVSEKLGLDRIAMNELELSPEFLILPGEAKNLFTATVRKELDSGTPLWAAMSRGVREIRNNLTYFANDALRATQSDVNHLETMLAQVYKGFGVDDMRQIRAASLDRIRDTVNASAEVIGKAVPLSKKDRRFFNLLNQTVPMASQRTDALVYTQMSMAAQEADTLSAHLLPAYEQFNLGMTEAITDRFQDLTKLMTVYRKSLTSGNDRLAAETLAKLGALHGEFQPLIGRAIMPTIDEVMATFRAASENTWYRFLGSKLEVGDGLVTMIGAKNWQPADIAALTQKAQNEVFAVGNLAQQRETWANLLTQKAGAVEQTLAVRQTGRAQLRARADEIGRILQSVGVAEPPTPMRYSRVLRNLAQRDAGRTIETIAEDIPLEAAVTTYMEQTGKSADDLLGEFAAARAVPKELPTGKIDETTQALQAELTAVKEQLDNPPTRPVADMMKDFQNHYDLLGRGMVDAVRRAMPDQYLTFLGKKLEGLDKRILSWGVNETQNIKGLQEIQRLANRAIDISRNKRISSANFRLYRESMANEGLSKMRSVMVDYTRESNAQRVLSSFLPFAAFQTHLPQYLARTFVNRPGYIAAMNHFIQSAEDRGAFRSGIPLFGSGFMFVPQLRFSWLPLLAGSNFVREEDSFQNQLMDFTSLFGFSPGPHIAASADLASEFGTQIGVPGLKGGEAEMKLGVVPQFRWLQDLTGIMGVNNGLGVSVPFLGASLDIRQREVQKELASRVATRINDREAELGRSLYPDEVLDIRNYVYEHEKGSAGRLVAAKDLALATVPGLRTYSESREEINRRVAQFLTMKGVEGATGQNVLGKYKELNSLDKAELFQQIPEFEDILAIPPYQEARQAKEQRKLRSRYYTGIKRLQAERGKTQRQLDKLLDLGAIDIVEWREKRSELRRTYVAGVEALRNDPELKPIVDREQQAPEDPGEAAWVNFNQLEPADFNGNGIIDDDDLVQFFDTRRGFLDSQPQHIQAYIEARRAITSTDKEKEFFRAQEAYDGYRELPKWVGMDAAQSRRAEAVIRQAQMLTRLSEGQQSLLQTVMTMPGVSGQDRLLAITALRSNLNPRRITYWQENPLLDLFYPDQRPSPQELQ